MKQVLLIVSANELSAQLLPLVRTGALLWKLHPTELETLYDWVVIEALSRVLRCTVYGHVSVAQYVQNDLYRCVYDELGFSAEAYVRSTVLTNGIRFLANQHLKVLVTFNELILVQSSAAHTNLGV